MISAIGSELATWHPPPRSYDVHGRTNVPGWFHQVVSSAVAPGDDFPVEDQRVVRERWPSRTPPRLRVDLVLPCRAGTTPGRTDTGTGPLASLLTSRSTSGLPVMLTGHWSSLQLAPGALRSRLLRQRAGV